MLLVVLRLALVVQHGRWAWVPEPVSSLVLERVPAFGLEESLEVLLQPP